MATPLNQIILRTFACGVRDVKTGRFYPFRTVTLTATGTVTPRATNTRLYLARAHLALSQVVGDAGTGITVTGIQEQDTLTLASLPTTTLTAGTFQTQAEVHMLLDQGKPIAVSANNISTKSVTLVLADVDDIPAEALHELP